MSSSYIPAQDAQALAWMQTFSSGISANPGLYSLSSAEAASISAAVDVFAAAYADAIDPAARGK